IAAVKFLLEAGVDVRAVTTYNENALFGPGYRGWNRMLELLIEKGADVNVVNNLASHPTLRPQVSATVSAAFCITTQELKFCSSTGPIRSSVTPAKRRTGVVRSRFRCAFARST